MMAFKNQLNNHAQQVSCRPVDMMSLIDHYIGFYHVMGVEKLVMMVDRMSEAFVNLKVYQQSTFVEKVRQLKANYQEILLIKAKLGEVILEKNISLSRTLKFQVTKETLMKMLDLSWLRIEYIMFVDLLTRQEAALSRYLAKPKTLFLSGVNYQHPIDKRMMAAATIVALAVMCLFEFETRGRKKSPNSLLLFLAAEALNVTFFLFLNTQLENKKYRENRTLIQELIRDIPARHFLSIEPMHYPHVRLLEDHRNSLFSTNNSYDNDQKKEAIAAALRSCRNIRAPQL